MADEKRDAPRPFDVTTVEYLLRLMSEHDLAEIDLKEGDQRIRLRKGAAMPAAFYPAPHAAPAPAAAPNPGTHAPAPHAAGAPAPAPPAPAKNYVEIKSPMVGTFYSKPDPAKPPYVTVGAKVKPTSVVCKLEAMKIFNEVTADCAGTVAEVCMKDGEFVEFGTVLFRVDPS